MSFFIELESAAAIVNAHSFLADVKRRITDGLQHNFLAEILVHAFENKVVVSGNGFFQSLCRTADEGSDLTKRIKFFNRPVGEFVLKRQTFFGLGVSDHPHCSLRLLQEFGKHVSVRRPFIDKPKTVFVQIDVCAGVVD